MRGDVKMGSIIALVASSGFVYWLFQEAKQAEERRQERLKPIIEKNAERKALLEKYNWDGADREELLRRVMLYSNLSPEEIGKYFSRQELGRVFLKNIHDFDKEKRKQWMEYLNIPEEEVERWE
ncbi:MAG: hypothetical protein QXM53_08095, partial [Thermofilaceae archaeon]